MSHNSISYLIEDNMVLLTIYNKDHQKDNLNIPLSIKKIDDVLLSLQSDIIIYDEIVNEYSMYISIHTCNNTTYMELGYNINNDSYCCTKGIPTLELKGILEKIINEK